MTSSGAGCVSSTRTQPSPLVSLIGDVEGALAYAAGENPDPSSVGLTADGLDVEVRLTRPAADFVSVVASPTFAVVPPGVGEDSGALEPGGLRRKRRLHPRGRRRTSRPRSSQTTTTGRAARRSRPSSSSTTSAGGARSQAFEDGDVDLTNIFPFDATWIAYDEVLGPQLREGSSLSVNYYGFDTTRPPFDDVRVRQAFAQAVDWRRLVSLVAGQTASVATGMVPIGIPGRSDEDFLPEHDPDAARQLLADAGYPGGEGFPETTMMTFGSPFDAAVVDEVERELGIELNYEIDGGDYFGRLSSEPPQMWSMGWVADYPSPNDFLGILLGTGSSNNYGRWSNADFDQAITDALATTDPETTRAAFDRAEALVRDEAPVIPLSYDAEWKLSRTGLLGAQENGLGITRMAGLAWDDQ